MKLLMNKLNFLYRFFFCIILQEKKILNSRIEYLFFIYKNLNLLKYFLFLINRDLYNPIKNHSFNQFISFNKKKWNKEKKYKKRVQS
jgi:hypothetical protein